MGSPLVPPIPLAKKPGDGRADGIGFGRDIFGDETRLGDFTSQAFPAGGFISKHEY